MCLVIMAFFSDAYPGNEQVLFREEFQDLAKWKEEFFPKIPRHTTYSIGNQGDRSYLKTQSGSSASLLIYTETFDVYAFPRVRWSWKIDGIIENGDAKTRQGDDYPIRVYIAFEYDPDRAGFLDRTRYGVMKALYGQYPPHSSLNYIWANLQHKEDVLDSPYTDRSRMILLEKGGRLAGVWVQEDIDIIRDYERAFGEKPPARATIGIMNDSDNTGGSATSYIDYLMVYRASGDLDTPGAALASPQGSIPVHSEN